MGGESRNADDDATVTTPTAQSTASHVLQNFSPSWFAISMDTGILSILLHQLPYQFRGLKVISTVAYLLNLTLFVVFTFIFLCRLSRYPRQAFYTFGTQIDELAALACPIVAYLTLVAMTAMTTSQTWGHGWAIFGYVLWWSSAFLSLCTLFGTFYLAARNALLSQVDISPQLFLPIVAILTAAAVGGLISDFTPISPLMAVPVIIVGYMFIGVGILFTFVLHVHYLYHNFTRGFLDRTRQTASGVLIIGPLGQASGAFILLGSAAQSNFGKYNKGTFLQASAGSALSAASIMMALLLLGFSFVLALTVFTFLLENIKRWKFSIGWWTLIFPVAVNVNALIALSTTMDSAVFRVLSTALTILLVVAWLVLAPLTLLNLRALLKIPVAGKNASSSHTV